MNSANPRPLPDPEISLRDARDFIIGSPLARRALLSTQPSLTLFFHDLLEVVYRLVQSCHLPEFTDHGLPHLCSLIERVSRWELPPTAGGTSPLLCEILTPDEAAMLLIALLIHDIGMLSQNPGDLPDDAPPLQRKALWSDVATWVRQTHVARLQKLLHRVMRGRDYQGLLASGFFQSAVDIAKSHQRWPWEWSGTWTANPRYRGLAAVVAVADLLDEDSARCDTITLLEHREGNLTNRAHWLRHALTENRVVVVKGQIEVQMVKPPGVSNAIRPLYSALRNHFRLVLLYETDLKAIDAPITNIDFHRATGLPDREAASLADWDKIDGFATEEAFCYQLLCTFMAPALKDARRISADTLAALRVASLEDVDLSILDRCQGSEEPRTEFEQTFLALAGGSI